MSTFNLYTADGVQKSYAFSFPYISKTHVKVFLNQQLLLTPMHYSIAGSTVNFVDVPEAGGVIEIKRQTSPSDILVDFQDGSTLKESDLDTAYLHNFYLSQEYSDGFNKLINDTLLRIAQGNAIVQTDPDEVIAALVNKILEDDAAADLQQRVNDIDTNAEAIVQLGTNLQVQVNGLAQGVAAVVYIQPGEPVPGVGGIPDPITDGARWYDSDDNNRQYIYDQAGAEWLDISDPRVGVIESDLTVLTTEVDDNAAAIVAESLARSTQDTALASTLALLGAQNGDSSAFIVDTSTVKIDSDLGDTLATRFSSLSATDSANTAAISAEETARVAADSALSSRVTVVEAETDANAAAIISETAARTSADSAQASSITALQASVATAEADITDNAAAIVTEASARATAVGAVASSVTALTSTVNGNTASITTNATAIDGLEATYSVEVNAGRVVGFILNSTQARSDFVIVADNFAIVEPGTFDQKIFWDGGLGQLQIDGDVIVTGTINGSSLINGTIGATQIGPNAITTDKLSANSITAAKIQANAITSDKINVTNLAAINANLGAITAGSLTLNTSGFVRGGATGFETGAGVYLGYDTSAYKFYVGDKAADQYISYDGSTLTVRGNFEVGEYEASDTAILSANTERSTVSPSFTTQKSFTMGKAGTVRIRYETRRGTPAGSVLDNAEIRVRKNGVALRTDAVSSGSYTAIQIDENVANDDVITIQIKGGSANPIEPTPFACFVRNAQIRADLVLTDDGSVNTD